MTISVVGHRGSCGSCGMGGGATEINFHRAPAHAGVMPLRGDDALNYLI